METAGSRHHALRSLMLVIIAASAAGPFVHAAEPNDILGIWNNQEKSARIEVFQCDQRYCGRIVWLKNPNYAGNSKNGTPGTPVLDHNNPDAALKTQPVVGLMIMRDFAFQGEDMWSGGSIYDPKNGKTYQGKMTLASPGELILRGYVGISLFGRDTTWKR